MIFLVRHGEAADSWGNHPDPGLSDLGQRQAEQVASQLMSLSAARAVSSPMQRCRETALPFERSCDVTAEISAEVSEIETPENVPDRVAWLRTYMSGTWRSEGRHHLVWRQAMLDRLVAVAEGTAIFTHFVAINAIVSALTGRDETIIFKPGHCSVTILVRENGHLKVQELGSESATRVL